MKCNPSRWLWGLIPIAMLTWGTFFRERPNVETDLTARAEEALNVAGQSWASVRLNGRDAIITGRSQKDGEAKVALDAVRAVWGIRTVQLKTDLAGAPAPSFGVGPGAERELARGVAPEVIENAGVDAIRQAEAEREALRQAQADAEELTARQEAEALRAKEAAAVELAAREAEDKARRDREAAAAREAAEAEAERKARLEQEAAAQRAQAATQAALKAQRDAEAAELQAQKAADAKAAREEAIAARDAADADAQIRAKQEADAAAARRAQQATQAALKAQRDSEADGAVVAPPQEDAEQKARLEALGREADRLRAEAQAAAQRKAQDDAEQRARLDALAQEADRLRAEAAAEKARREAETAAAAEAARREAEAAAAAEQARWAAEAAAAAETARRDAEDAAAAEKARQEAEAAAAKKAREEAERAARKTTEETRACERRLADAAKRGVILFDWASDAIDRKSARTIARLAEIIVSCPGSRVEVEGHTDAEGIPERNQPLSERRAQAVVDSLVAAGVPTERLTSVGYAAERPVATNDTQAGRAKNRRIEFRVFLD
ncbi:OmpA family protein [Hyphomicrobium sp.]|uniref:OmpA family protein n=1 Tax=Hyphomicrobium sp. TaxID=82 RepID=UPI002C6DDB92|nr:OmpA family protein [Hyphomicrobium sp.]HRN88186.1 OmpA family protein [Hyphomicrobium sp.]HRQ26254.1 OmpA family protein [Hyphomicrobium sp.]